MLIQIEEGTHGANWVVKLDNYPVKCRSLIEAKEFADRMASRLNAPHTFPAKAQGRSARQVSAQAR
jgi:hypothetical protein